MMISLPTRNSVPLTWAAGGLAASLVLGGLALYFRNELSFYVRLLNAKLIADRFYAEYNGITKNIPYGEHPAEKLDVYQPSSAGPHPVLIWVHGGGWSSGSKELYAPVAQRVLPENIVVVIPGYTLFPNAGAFDQAQEIARAFQWTRKNIARYGGDSDRIILGGHSAGAHLSGLVALDRSYLTALNHSTEEICGWYGIAGPYSIPAQLEHERTDKRNYAKLLYDFFGGQANFDRGSPQSFVRADTMPILLIHGSADATVPLSMGETFHNALRALRAPCTLQVYQGAGHSGLLFDALAHPNPQLVTDLIEFAKSCPTVARQAPLSVT